MSLGRTETDDVETVDRVPVEAAGRPRAASDAPEVAAAEDPEGNADWFMPQTITCARSGFVATECVLAPLEHVPVHVVEPKPVRLLLLYRMQPPSRVAP